MTVQILRGNALALPLADDSVDLVVTSPPYYALRTYTDGGVAYDGQIGSEGGGTGTTALVADVLGRHGITVDMSADYCRLATWRTSDPRQRAKAARIAKPAVRRPTAPSGQLELFRLTTRGATA